MKPLAPNTLLQNRYLIVHLIGKGGMGEVYLAVDQRLGSAIALKRTLHADDANLGDAFEREARTLARLRHPVLPKVSDHFIENENQYLVMDHISGDDLAKRLTATGKPFPLSWVLFWADQLLDALAYLHTHEPPIIHRDIKPQNLKLTDDNNIVLLDFGLSKSSAAQTSFANPTGTGSTGSVVGYTPHYAPMEQIRGTGTSARSDIYSLSATLYQLLTNVVPPDALSRADFLLSGKNDPITPINEINSEIPKAISDVVIKGMSISQDHRFADAREMQRVLRETYAKMQSEASDKTIAFNVQDEQVAPSAAAQTSAFSNDQTEQFSVPVFDPPPVSKEAMGAQTIPFGMIGNTNAETQLTDSGNADKTEQFQDFDQTIRIDDLPDIYKVQNDAQKTDVFPVADSAPPQANIKTEVLGSDFGAAEYLNDHQSAPPQNFATEEFGAQTGENSAPPQNFTGDKTVPLINLGNQTAPVDFAQTQPASAFDSVAPIAATQLPENSFAQLNEQSYPQAVPNYDSQPNQVQTPPVPPQKQEKKKSKGFLFAILGALFGLVILAAAGGGIAWYLMNQPQTTNATNVATPTPESSPTPTPSPDQANTNTGDNSNTGVVTSGNTNSSNVNTAPSPETTKTVAPTPTPVTDPTKPPVTPRPTQATTKPPVTPKPTIKPDVKPTIRGSGSIPQ